MEKIILTSITLDEFERFIREIIKSELKNNISLESQPEDEKKLITINV